MAISNFVPALWSAAFQQSFDKTFVYAANVNRKWEGEIKGPGDRVRIPTVNAPSSRAYVKGTPITYDAVDGTYQDLVIDQARYFGLTMEDIDQVQVKPAMLAESVRLANIDVADVADVFVRDLMIAGAGIKTDLGTDGAPLQVNSADLLGFMALIGEKMDTNRIPRGGRWAIVPPWFIKKLALSKIGKDTANSGVLSSGYVGQYMGFDIYMSPNVKNTTGAKWNIVAGTNDGTTFASQITKMEAMRSRAQFADDVRGLYVYGGKVVYPNALALAIVNEKAE
jgi:hypothetical protein